MNLFPKMMEELGLKVGEKFNIKIHNHVNERVKFWFTDEGLMCDAPWSDKEYHGATFKTIVYLLFGLYEVVKIPWVPETGEHYWYVRLTSETDYPQTAYGQMQNNLFSLINLIHHNYFKTQEEAEKCKYEVVRNLQRIYENQYRG